MPTDFLETLSGLTARYKVYKAGLALPVYPEQELTKQTKKRHKTDPFPYHENITVTDWERQHWRFPLIDDRYTLYAAPVDTTFAVYRKSNYIGNFFDAVRLSGEDFDAIHLPWVSPTRPVRRTAKASLSGRKPGYDLVSLTSGRRRQSPSGPEPVSTGSESISSGEYALSGEGGPYHVEIADFLGSVSTKLSAASDP